MFAPICANAPSFMRLNSHARGLVSVDSPCSRLLKETTSDRPGRRGGPPRQATSQAAASVTLTDPSLGHFVPAL